ncbi:MAG: T9SS type A sorting domain-containing protein [Bacteroidales bacterium]|nr:T9SS type A sorting domain-containing protein [Bacteroidales bacterium]
MNILNRSKCFMLVCFLITLISKLGYSQANSGFHYFTNAIDVSHPTTGAWSDVDVSTHVPAGATGVILELVNEGIEETASRHAVRKNGSTNSLEDKFRISDHGHRYAFCGLDENRLFESYIETASCKIYLLGYTDNFVTFFPDGYNRTPSATGTWDEIDVSDIVPEGTKGIIIEAYSINGNSNIGVRKAGSIDDRTDIGSNVYSYRNATYLYCGLDQNRKFEGKVTGADGRLSIVGYISSQAEFFDNAINVSITPENVWTDIDLSGILPLRANGVIFEINNDQNARRYASIRKKGSTDDRSNNSGIYNSGMTQGLCGLDENNRIQAYVNNQTVDIYIIGYTLPYDSTPPSNITTINDGTGVDIDNSYSIRDYSANWSASSDIESGISFYWYALGTTIGGTDIVDWTSNGNNTDVTVSGLNLTAGHTYYISVKAENGQGHQSNVNSSDGVTIVIDPSTPLTISQVRDGLSLDISFSYPTGSLSANWDESNDPESNIYRYWYAVDTIQGGISIIDWTDNGLERQFTYTGLSLIPDKTYYTSVRAENKAGLLSASASSNGVLIIPDATPPTDINEVRDGFFSDVDDVYYTDRLSANWSPSVDDESGILYYWYSLGTTAGGHDVINWTKYTLDTILFLEGLSLNVGTKYYLSIRAENGSGAFSNLSSSDGFIVNEMDPNIYIVECRPGTDISDKIQTGVDFLVPSGGGSIYLPEGTYLLENTVNLSSNIRLIGAGMNKTIINMAETASFSAVNGGDSLIRIAHATYRGYGIISFRSVVDFRIDHCHFIASRNSAYMVGINNRGNYPSTRGVIDHCRFSDDEYTSTYGIHCGPKVWPAYERSINLLGIQEAVFIEDCFMDEISNHPVSAFNGANYVLRYSYSTRSGSIDGHGPVFETIVGDGTDQQRGTRCYEIYNNTFVEPPEAGYDERWSALGLRGGGGVVYNNEFINFRYAVRFTMETGSVQPAGGIYPGIDQIHDMWVWNNQLTETPELILLNANNADMLIQEDRDYYLRQPSYDEDGFTYHPYIYPHPLINDPIIGEKVINFSSQIISICEGENYFAQGENQTETGIYIDTLVNMSGGDSLVITNLRVYPLYKSIDVLIHEGESYYAGGHYQTTAGTYIDHIGNVNGCDSLILQTNLIITNYENTLYDNNTLVAYISPNPSFGKFSLRFSIDEPSINIEVFSDIGKMVYQEEYSSVIAGSHRDLDLSKFNAGIYFVKIHSKRKFELHKIIILR